ncbi:hypothetical protein ACFFQW_08910 [Umezawaea endophytica]|uniref:Uncharacterized protein n=1 Tax=Umezawaea endophytica TaxID=1654476 RepID=A0A9X2VGC4_9PSEU|nr:hypothetical protein [Umezawaea endophytica]MCS7476106.1 hypothetical protein [Umezawaea endophytica]
MTERITTAAEVRRLFNVTEASRDRFNNWHSTRPRVAAHALGHAAAVVNAVTSADAEAVFRRDSLEAALSARGQPVLEIDDWRPEFALAHTFHHAVEELGRLPGWAEFRAFCQADEQAVAMVWGPAADLVDRMVGRGVEGSVARAAMRRRIGREYAAFVRSVHVAAALRERGLPALTHPLAEAVFGVDAWAGRVVFVLRDGPHRAEELLFQAMPPFFFERVPGLGKGLPSDRGLDIVVRRLTPAP